jgi:hypothetical protein
MACFTQSLEKKFYNFDNLCQCYLTILFISDVVINDTGVSVPGKSIQPSTMFVIKTNKWVPIRQAPDLNQKHLSTLKRLARDKHSGLISQSSEKKKSFITFTTCYGTILFISDVVMNHVGVSVLGKSLQPSRMFVIKTNKWVPTRLHSKGMLPAFTTNIRHRLKRLA